MSEQGLHDWSMVSRSSDIINKRHYVAQNKCGVTVRPGGQNQYHIVHIICTVLCVISTLPLMDYVATVYLFLKNNSKTPLDKIKNMVHSNVNL